jgi:centrosomal protein CEP104
MNSNRNDPNTDPTVLAVVKRPDYISPLDDLAFAMYQDQEISSIILDLDKKKTEAVLSMLLDKA